VRFPAQRFFNEYTFIYCAYIVSYFNISQTTSISNAILKTKATSPLHRSQNKVNRCQEGFTRLWHETDPLKPRGFLQRGRTVTTLQRRLSPPFNSCKVM
jgi:hypothetical protein